MALKETRRKRSEPLWLGGVAASAAACFTHPLDQTKYRMQVVQSKESMVKTLTEFARRDGITSLWQGISASILRQMTYSSARFGIYEYGVRELQSKTNGSKLSVEETIALSGFAGGLAGLIGNPTEVGLVRMCADGIKPLEERYKYGNGPSALVTIARTEGINTLAKGLVPNVVRSVLMNVGQIATYSVLKNHLLSTYPRQFKDNTTTHLISSLAAGTVATTLCAPADVLKSRIQNSSKSNEGHSSTLGQILRRLINQEGWMALFKGWTPAWVRIAPHTVLTFVFLEQLRAFVQRF